MVLGVGVDMVDINEVKRYMGINDSFERHTFTTAEQRIAENEISIYEMGALLEKLTSKVLSLME